MARTTSLDDLIEQRIVTALKAGNTPRQASECAGISVATFYAWKVRGRKGEPRFVEFLDRVEKANAEAEAESVKIIRNAALNAGTWQAAAWWLERRRWKQWGRKDALLGKPAEDAGKLSNPELIAEIEKELSAAKARMTG